MALSNINSLSKHINELEILMVNKPVDILSINESKLGPNDTNEAVNLPGYKLVRRDRNKNGGGVCVYLRDTINYKRRFDLENFELEIIVLEIFKPNCKPFLVVNWYRPPKSPLHYFDLFELFLKNIERMYNEIYILGDLNCNMIAKPLMSVIIYLFIFTLYFYCGYHRGCYNASKIVYRGLWIATRSQQSIFRL